jgi:hypothetical protein
MKATDCLPAKAAKFFIAAILMIGALGFIVIGFTVLPIIGFVIAIPFVALAIYFIKVHLNDQCQIEP